MAPTYIQMEKKVLSNCFENTIHLHFIYFGKIPAKKKKNDSLRYDLPVKSIIKRNKQTENSMNAKIHFISSISRLLNFTAAGIEMITIRERIPSINRLRSIELCAIRFLRKQELKRKKKQKNKKYI